MSDEPDLSTVFYVDHDPDTGRIIGQGMTQRVAWDYHRTTIPSVEGTGAPDTHYVLDGVITARPVLAGFDKTTIVADGEDEASITLPEPMNVEIDEVTHEVTDTLAISSDMPATYRVRIEHFPWQTYETEIVAT